MNQYPVNSVSYYFDRFITQCKIKNLATSTIKYYKENFAIFRKFHNDEDIRTISQENIDNYILYLKGLTISEISVNTNLRAIRAIVNYWAEIDAITPISIKQIKAQKKIKETFTNTQLQKLLKRPTKKCSFPTFRNWTIVNFLLGTGARANSVIHVRVCDIDFDNLTIWINNTKSKKDTSIPMSLTLEPILREYLHHRRPIADNDYFFVNEDGSKMTVTALSRTIRRYNLRKGFNNGSLHIYRHTFAKLWILNGGDLFSLQKILGHTNMNTVKEYVEMFGNDLTKTYSDHNPLDKVRAERIKMDREYKARYRGKKLY
jgi:integrase/recombinase XerD